MSIDFSITLERGTFRLQAEASLPSQGSIALVGRSGCGKTSLLRALAGLEQRLSGSIQFGSERWFDSAQGLNLPAARRGIGYVFQKGALFEHMSVRENLDYALKRSPAQGRRSRDEIIALTGIGALLPRRPASLSGGETQRVALGRALSANPKLLLLDEPFSALDWQGREELMRTLETFFAETKLPTLLVTHNLSEAARLSAYALRMEDGAITASGPSDAILPASYAAGDGRQEPFVTYQGTVASTDEAYQLTSIEAPLGPLLVPGTRYAQGARVRLILWARDVSIALEPLEKTSHLNVLSASVNAIDPFDSGQLLVSLSCRAAELKALVTRKSAESLGLAPGTACHCLIKSVSLT